MTARWTTIAAELLFAFPTPAFTKRAAERCHLRADEFLELQRYLRGRPTSKLPGTSKVFFPMPMHHKAYSFDYRAFCSELRSVLENALVGGDIDELRRFIATNLRFLKDPNEGKPLSLAWESLVEPKDEHQYGDLALTKFYEPLEAVGLGYDWMGWTHRMGINDLLNVELGDGQMITLGQPCGLPENYFDPGKSGSYFQSPELVKENLGLLDELLRNKPSVAPKLRKVQAMLRSAVSANRGLHVTF